MGIVSAIMVPHPPLIVPQIGQGGEKQIAKTTAAYEEAARRLALHKPDTVIVLSPHQIMYSDYFHISPGSGATGSFAAFHAPEVSFAVQYDAELVADIAAEAAFADISAGILGERDKKLDHGTMVPLYFLNKYYSDYRIVRIGLSGMPLLTHYEFGKCIRRAADKSNKKIAIIASGDLSHKLRESGPYGFCPDGPLYDERIMNVMGSANFGELFDFSESFCSNAAECGHRSFTIMAGALDCLSVQAEALSHEDVTGVGYGVCTYEILGEDKTRNFGEQQKEKEEQALRKLRESEDAYVRFARAVIEQYVREGAVPAIPDDLPRELYEQRAGAFVSIKKCGQLRGCIGTILPVQDTLAEEILENAVSASTRDPRFDPITSEELSQLVISVDILGEPEDIQSPEQLDVVKYGVIVTRGNRRGLLLPNLDGVNTVEDQIRIARQKAGIKENEPVHLQRFEVVRHH